MFYLINPAASELIAILRLNLAKILSKFTSYRRSTKQLFVKRRCPIKQAQILKNTQTKTR
nr:hypothetical protein [uncultured Campylobacter sp.]